MEKVKEEELVKPHAGGGAQKRSLDVPGNSKQKFSMQKNDRDEALRLAFFSTCQPRLKKPTTYSWNDCNHP